jgi:FkbM family methyltransferase
MGPFEIPALPEVTRQSCLYTCKEVWEGTPEYPFPSYEHADLPPADAVHVVIDVGCNIGAFSAWARKRWNDDIGIYGYEPIHEAALFAEQNNPFLVLIEAAVTCDPDPVLSLYPQWGRSSTHFVNDHGPAYPRAVEAVHPSKLPPCDVLKIDCEGSEADVLANYQHFTSVKCVMYEFHNEKLMNLCSLYCRRAGLRMVHLFDTAVVRKSTHHSGTAIWVK